MDVRDKVTVIAGGTGGLGRTVTRAFAQAGARVVVPYTTALPRELELLRADLGTEKTKVTAIETDVTDEASVQRLASQVIERFHRIDVLLCLVGGYLGGVPVAHLTKAQWDQQMGLNLMSAFYCCKAVAPHMVAQQRGRIVCVSSRAAEQVSGGDAAYAASKAGVVSLVKALDKEHQDYPALTVNAILPSVIDTPVNRQAMPTAAFDRWVKPQEIANVLLFLASDASSAIRGAAIPVYGRA